MQYRKLPFQPLTKFIGDEQKFLELLIYRIKAVGIKKFNIDNFALIYPERFLGFLYVDEFKKVKEIVLNNKKESKKTKELKYEK